MRNTFIKTLTCAARENEKIVLLMAEVGFSVVEGFEKEFPNRFYNTGIAEQNLVSVAAGMAMGGHLPVAYSMSCFLPTRAFEQIKVDVCYQEAPVTLVGVGTGLSYGNMGATHHAIEDINIMVAIPGMTVVCPSDPIETEALLLDALKLNSPCYFAIGKNNDPVLAVPGSDIKIGKANWIREGKDAVIIAVGGILANAIAASDLLARQGVSAAVVSMHTIKPVDMEALAKAFTYPAVFTLDEHNISGGFSQIVAYAAMENGFRTKVFHSYAVRNLFAPTVGGRDYLLNKYGLDGESLALDMHNRMRAL